LVENRAKFDLANAVVRRQVNVTDRVENGRKLQI
jgi:hypothetical protein